MQPKTILILCCIFAVLLYSFYNYRSRCKSTTDNGGDNAVRERYERACQLFNEIEDRVQPQNAQSPNAILPYLYVGDRSDAYSNEKLAAYGITHILDMTAGDSRPCEHRDVPIVYKLLASQDHPFFDISQHFDEAYAFIEDAREHGGIVLVHCNAGVSRSAITAAMYLARKYGLNARDAILAVKKKRRKIRPNIGFVQQLMEIYG